MIKSLCLFLLFFSLVFVLSFYWFFYRNGGISQYSDKTTPYTRDPYITPGQNNEEVLLVAVGDIMLSREVERRMKKQNDFAYPFRDTWEELADADIVFGNLETPIIEGGEVPDGVSRFRSDPKALAGLTKAGLDIVSLANNHAPDQGEVGLAKTFEYLDAAKILYVGAGKNIEEANQLRVIDRGNLRVGFLAYNDSDVVPDYYEASEKRAGTAFMRTERMIEAVTEAKLQTDVIVVSMHSGTEYSKNANQRQMDFARAAVDAGADMVIGHHPHVIQPIEKYKGKTIIYSLGNFIFDQMWSAETRQGLTAWVTLTSSGVKDVKYRKVLIEDYSRPKWLD